MKFKELNELLKLSPNRITNLSVRFHKKLLIPKILQDPYGRPIPIVPHLVSDVDVELREIDMTYHVDLSDISDDREFLLRAQHVAVMMTEVLKKEYGESVDVGISNFEFSVKEKV